MSTRDASNALLSYSKVLQASLAAIFLVYVALIPIAVFGEPMKLTFLPLAAILLWPPTASYTWSAIAIFLIGMLHDALSFGPDGLWAFCYLSVFALAQGGFEKLPGFARNFIVFLLGCLFASSLVALLGRILVGHWPQWTGLFYDFLASLAAFPLVYAVFVLTQSRFREARL